MLTNHRLGMVHIIHITVTKNILKYYLLRKILLKFIILRDLLKIESKLSNLFTKIISNYILFFIN